jgi:hypothetical protein
VITLKLLSNKWFLAGVAILVFLALLWDRNRLQNKVADLEVERSQAVEFAASKTLEIERYKTIAGNEAVKVHNLELSLRNAQELSNTDRLSFAKEFAGVKKDFRNLESTLQASIDLVIKKAISNKDTTFVFNGDTTKAKTWAYMDEYNSFSGINMADTTLFDGWATVPVKAVRYWEKKHKFIFKKWRYGKKEYFTEATSPNKLVYISTIEIIDIKR